RAGRRVAAARAAEEGRPAQEEGPARLEAGPTGVRPGPGVRGSRVRPEAAESGTPDVQLGPARATRKSFRCAILRRLAGRRGRPQGRRPAPGHTYPDRATGPASALLPGVKPRAGRRRAGRDVDPRRPPGGDGGE